MTNDRSDYYPDPNSYTDYSDSYECKYCGCVSSKEMCPTCGAPYGKRFK